MCILQKLMWLFMRKQKFTFLCIAPLTDSIHVHGPGSILLSPPHSPPSTVSSAKLDICLAISEHCGPFKQSSHCLSFRCPLYPTLSRHLNTWSLLPTSSQSKRWPLLQGVQDLSTIFLSKPLSPHNLNPFCKWL